jgi:hypothetical protein
MASRYQYGVNFRTGAGRSYSPADLTRSVPYGINLNLVMDGIIVDIVGNHLRPHAEALASRSVDAADCATLQELSAKRPTQPGKGVDAFFSGVVSPTRTFFDYWGHDTRDAFVRGMLTGDVAACKTHMHAAVREKANDEGLRTYLAARRGFLSSVSATPDTWETLFAARDYLATRP